MIQDLRQPDIDETPLSDEEVRHGVTRAFIAPGPHAHSRAFAEVTVHAKAVGMMRRTVEVWQIEGGE